MQSLRRNLGYQMIYRVLTVITPLITSPVISRALGAEKLGLYSATLAFVNYFMLFAMLGVENYGTREIAAVQDDRQERQKRFWNIYAVQLCAAVTAMAAYGLCMFTVAPDRLLLSLLQGCWLISALLDINWFYFGCEEFRLTVIRNIVIKLLTVAGIVLFVRTQDDLMLYAAIMAGSMVASQIVGWAVLPRFLGFARPVWSEVRRHIRPVLQLFLPLLAFSVFHIMDKTMLDLFSDETNLGYYYSADKLINIPLGIIYAIGTVMLPRVTHVMRNGQSGQVKVLLKQSAELTMALVAAVGFGIAAIAPEFVPLFFGQGYEPCVQLVYCFVPVLVVKACSNLVRSLYLIPAEKDRLYTVAVCGGAVVNLLMNYALIRRYGAMGAVLGTLAAETATLAVQMIGCRNDVNFLRYIAANFYYLAFGAVMVVIVRMAAVRLSLPAFPLVAVLVMIGAAVYLACCVCAWHICKNSMFHMAVRRKCKM